jgi:hypothetical protein
MMLMVTELWRAWSIPKLALTLDLSQSKASSRALKGAII